jgi:2-polyprenyl-6-methoxyphenol hydroxylase-like FAD-dependent oxidoreductase
MKILIAGGGIGGMTAALRLHAAGIDVEVFESVVELKELGVGINLLPHAVRELTELGLLGALAATAIETRALSYYTQYGHHIMSEPRGKAAGYAWPQFSIHRGSLLMILAKAVRERVGAAHVHTGHQFDSFSQDNDGVTARFVHPESKEAVGEHRGDLLLGADGIHSRVRRILYPDEGLPNFSGITMWRGVTEREPFLDGRTMIVAGTWNKRMVIYPISEKARGKGRSLVNWVAEIRDENKIVRKRDNWSRVGDKADFLPAFADWHFDWLDIPRLIEENETAYDFPMVDREPLKRWSFGRVTLLGDAAHPMYPSGSNGAAQAILDATALANILVKAGSIEDALIDYQNERMAPTTNVVLSNRDFLAERVLDLVEERCPENCQNIQDFVSNDELQQFSREYQRIAGFDKESLDAKDRLDST